MRNSMNLKALIAGQPVNEQHVALGDDVVVGDKKREGVVKVPSAPSDTVGVLIDGELEMVPADDVTVAPKEASETDENMDESVESDDLLLQEGILGMTMMPGFARMQELAGIRSNLAEDVPAFLKKDDEDDSETDEPEAEDTAAADDASEEAHDDANEDGDEVALVVAAEPEPTEEVVQAADDFEQAVETQPVTDVAANHPATAGEVTMMSAPVEPEPMDTEVQETAETPEQICLDAIAKIESSLPEISVKQFNDIRKRLEAVMNSLLEGVEGRVRKL